MMMPVGQPIPLMPGITQWRQLRNTVIVALAEEAALTPTQISMLRYEEMYDSARPVETLAIGDRVVGPGKGRSVSLSDRVRWALAAMNAEPYLLPEFPHARSAFTARAGRACALSPRQIRRIIRTSKNHG